MSAPVPRRRAAPALRVRELDVRTEGTMRALLTDVNFDVAPGEAVGVVGHSGAGKSTLAGAIAGLLPRGVALGKRAQVHLGDVALHEATPDAWRDLRGRRIAMVFQEPAMALDPAMRIGDLVAQTARWHGMPAREARDRAHDMLGRVGFRQPARAARAFPHELSGGQRQRALIASAMLLAPELLIADEPTTALDPTVQAQVLDLIDRLRAESGTALLLISHDLEVVAERCGRALVVAGGRLVDDAPSAQVLAGARARRTPIGQRAVGAAAAAPAPLLDVRGLTVTYPGPRLGLRRAPDVRAVVGADLAIGRGEVVALVGESGCGKSSLAHAVLRLVAPAAGTVRFDGLDVLAQRGGAMRALRRRMQLVPQDAGASLTPHLRTGDLVAEALEVHGLAQGAEAWRRAEALLDEVGLPARAAQALPHHLSSGERQRVALARALASDPDLLVADEPLAAVDEAARTQVLALLERRRVERGLAVLLISHDLPAVRRLASRVLVMYLGRVVEASAGAGALSDPRMPYTQALVAAIPTGDPAAPRRRPALPEARVDADASATGCAFHPRCPHPLKDDRCRSERPSLQPVATDQPGHLAACWMVPPPPTS